MIVKVLTKGVVSVVEKEGMFDFDVADEELDLVEESETVEAEAEVVETKAVETKAVEVKATSALKTKVVSVSKFDLTKLSNMPGE